MSMACTTCHGPEAATDIRIRNACEDGNPCLSFVVTSMVNRLEPLYSWVILAWQAAEVFVAVGCCGVSIGFWAEIWFQVWSLGFRFRA